MAELRKNMVEVRNGMLSCSLGGCSGTLSFPLAVAAAVAAADYLTAQL